LRAEPAPLEVVVSLLVTIAAAVALIPLAGRVYAGGILRTATTSP
jgi:hypothetical protein